MKTVFVAAAVSLLTVVACIFIAPHVVESKQWETRDSARRSSIFVVGKSYNSFGAGGRSFRFTVKEIGPDGWIRIEKLDKGRPVWLNSRRFRDVTER